MNELAVHDEEQQEPKSVPEVFYISWRIKESKLVKIAQKGMTHCSPHCHQFSIKLPKNGWYSKFIFFVVFLPFQGDINKIWTK